MSDANPYGNVPPRVEHLLRQVDSGNVLGASRQLGLIGDALLLAAESYPGDADGLRELLRQAVQQVIDGRGASSKAITNGIRIMSETALSVRGDIESTKERLRSAVIAFQEALARSLAAVEANGATLMRGCASVLVYDYSSSVAALIGSAARSGDEDLTVIVPEARSLDGGRKYLHDWHDLDLAVKVIPDAAIGWALGSTDLVLVGAETLTLEGGCYNTIGTEMTARIAAQDGVPFYVVSVLLKTDMADETRDHSTVPMLDFSRSFNSNGEDVSIGTTADFLFPDLDYTSPEYITGLVTEVGVLYPDGLRAAASREVRFGVSA